MLEIIDIAKSMPSRIQCMDDAHSELALSNKDRRMFERFFGLSEFPRDANQSLRSMTDAAIAVLDSTQRNGVTTPDFAVHCHTLLSCGPFGSDVTSPLNEFRAGGLETFGATMNHCASGVAVLEMMEALLKPGQTALIVIGDKAFHPAVRLIGNTTIMGEGAVAMLVGRQTGRYRLIGQRTNRRGEFSTISGRTDEDAMNGFEDHYTNFTATTIDQTLKQNGLSMQSIRLVLPHNVNLPSWQQIAGCVGISRDQLYLENVPRYGHTFAADPFLNLVDAESEGRLQEGDRVLLVSVGLGATAACAVLECRPPLKAH